MSRTVKPAPLEGEIIPPDQFCPDCGAWWKALSRAPHVKHIWHPDWCPSKGSRGPYPSRQGRAA